MTLAPFAQFLLRSTGKERDSESGNDYFGARYYASTMGRFLSPDWSAKVEPVPYSKLDNPQTLNLYNYMRNNPLAGVDPDGHCCEDEPPEEEVREEGKFEESLSEARESLNRRDAVEANQREAQTVKQFNESHPGGYDDANGVSHAGPASKEDVEQMQASNRDKLGSGKVGEALGAIDKGGFQVTQNPKSPGQEGNITITNPSEPGTKLNVRVETHPLDSTGKPVRHANVERVEPGPKNRPVVKTNTHITE